MKQLLVIMTLISMVLAGCGPQQPPNEAGSTTTQPPQVETEASPAAADTQAPVAPAEEESEASLTVGVMPKLVGIDFFNATEKGAKEAGAELGVDLVYDGPATNDVQKQIEMIETWISRGFDAIAVAPNDPDAIVPVLEDARAEGITVVTWDADAAPSARDYFANQCTSASVAKALMDTLARNAGDDANYIIITGSLTAANQNIWMAEMEKYRQERYPNMTNLSPEPKVSEEDQALATQVTTDVLKVYPDLDGILAITSVALPGAAEAVRAAGAADQVFLTGLATPNVMREYVKDGTVKEFVLWNAVDLGYLAVQVAVAATTGELAPGAETFNAGRLGQVQVNGTEVVLGDPIIFSADNIDNFDF